MDNLGQLVCTKTETCGLKRDSFAGDNSESKIGMYGIRIDWAGDDEDDGDGVVTVATAEGCEEGEES